MEKRLSPDVACRLVEVLFLVGTRSFGLQVMVE
jgi:hypothetical protein